MDVDAIIKTLCTGNQLKRTARTGWVQRGVVNAEDVAAHSYGVCFTTLILGQIIDHPLDLGRALAMAVLHDLPEGLTSDIPRPAWRFLPPGTKSVMERGAIDEILEGIPFAGALMELWLEAQANETAEAHLVHDADRLDVLLQALIYEEHTGNHQLQEFWQAPSEFYFAEAQAIYEELQRRHTSVKRET